MIEITTDIPLVGQKILSRPHVKRYRAWGFPDLCVWTNTHSETLFKSFSRHFSHQTQVGCWCQSPDLPPAPARHCPSMLLLCWTHVEQNQRRFQGSKSVPGCRGNWRRNLWRLDHRGIARGCHRGRRGAWRGGSKALDLEWTPKRNGNFI